MPLAACSSKKAETRKQKQESRNRFLLLIQSNRIGDLLNAARYLLKLLKKLW